MGSPALLSADAATHFSYAGSGQWEPLSLKPPCDDATTLYAQGSGLYAVSACAGVLRIQRWEGSSWKEVSSYDTADSSAQLHSIAASEESVLIHFVQSGEDGSGGGLLFCDALAGCTPWFAEALQGDDIRALALATNGIGYAVLAPELGGAWELGRFESVGSELLRNGLGGEARIATQGETLFLADVDATDRCSPLRCTRVEALRESEFSDFGRVSYGAVQSPWTLIPAGPRLLLGTGSTNNTVYDVYVLDLGVGDS